MDRMYCLPAYPIAPSAAPADSPATPTPPAFVAATMVTGLDAVADSGSQSGADVDTDGRADGTPEQEPADAAGHRHFGERHQQTAVGQIVRRGRGAVEHRHEEVDERLAVLPEPLADEPREAGPAARGVARLPGLEWLEISFVHILAGDLERIELSSRRWQRPILPLNYARNLNFVYFCESKLIKSPI